MSQAHKPEEVFCFPTAQLPEPSPHVLPLDETLYHFITKEGEFRVRSGVETDERFRQIIPYAVLEQEDHIFLVERLKAGSEARLHNRLSIGLGGHINPVDGSVIGANARDPIEGALTRELREELAIKAFFAEAVGLIHRDETPVERVHTGILYRVKTLYEEGGEVKVRETDKLAGGFVTWQEVEEVEDRLEGWSQAALRFLRKTETV